jgi:hypothetical protein
MAPRGNIIFSAGDPTSIVEDLIPTMKSAVVPELLDNVAAPKGVRFVVAKVRRITEWRHFFHLQAKTRIHDKPKMLKHSGHGSVTLL